MGDHTLLLQALILMYFVIEDHDTLFIISEIVHVCGILILGYKLLNKRNSGGMFLCLDFNLTTDIHHIPYVSFPFSCRPVVGQPRADCSFLGLSSFL